MDILVIDREPLAAQLISSKLTAKGHNVTAETMKNDALDRIKEENFDLIFIDPAPLTDPQPMIFGIWKNLQTKVYPYVVMLAKGATRETAISAGCNDALAKPLDAMALHELLDNAERLTDLYKQLDEGDDYPSEGEVISKSAFNKLMWSAVDRAFRYSDSSFIVLVKIENYEDMEKAHGEKTADTVLHNMVEKLSFMCRRCDMVGRIGHHEFAILLQRPRYESEPMDAIGRFAEVLDKFRGEDRNKGALPEMSLSIIELPFGKHIGSRYVPKENARHEERSAE